MTADTAINLTPAQRAAAAKIACGISRPGGVAVLCGPHGVGKTTVLAHLATDPRLGSLSVESLEMEAWEASLAGGRREFPDIVIADEAHLASEGGIARLLAASRGRRPAASVVLAGEGRLLTLISRDSRVEQAIQLRASLRPCTLPESRDLLTTVTTDAACAWSMSDEAVLAIHELAAGIPAGMRRLAALAAVLSAANPDRGVTADDIEAIHRRMAPLAA
jgi:type II secretory pathway predicted ATPase ExeA